MIKSINYSIKLLLNPKTLLFAAFIFLIDFALLLLTAPFTILFLFDTTLAKNIPVGEITNLPFDLMSIYSFEITVLILLSFVSLFLQNIMLFYYAKLVEQKIKEQKFSPSEAMSYTFKMIGKAFWFTLLITFVLLIIFVLFGILTALFTGIPIILIPLILAATLGLIYIFVSIYFAIPAMVAQNLNIKQGLAESWNFISQNFWKTVLFILIIGLIGTILTFIESGILSLWDNDIFFFIVLFVISAVVYSFNSIAPAVYYFRKNFNQDTE